MFLIFSASISFGGENFEGTITYSVNLVGEDASTYADFMPDTYDYYFSESGAKLTSTGGNGANHESLILFKKNKGLTTYLMKPTSKIAQKITDAAMAIEEKSSSVYEEEDVIDKIYRYNCRKFKLISDVIDRIVWTSDEITVDDRVLRWDGFLPVLGADNLPGFPMKVMESIPGMSLTIIMTVSNVISRTIINSEIEIPDDYTVEEITLDELNSTNR